MRLRLVLCHPSWKVSLSGQKRLQRDVYDTVSDSLSVSQARRKHLRFWSAAVTTAIAMVGPATQVPAKTPFWSYRDRNHNAVASRRSDRSESRGVH